MTEENLTPKEYLSRQRPMIATPCYGGMVHEPYLRGMTSLVGAAGSIGMSVNIATITNESLITRARNELVKYLLMTDCTHLFFIDSDILFKPDDVFRALLHDKDVVAGAYPLKKIRWDNINASAVQSVEDIKRMSTDYVINIKFANEEQKNSSRVPVVQGLIEVYDAGTGFMCIKRHVIEKMINAYPETRYVKEQSMPLFSGDDGARWALFDTMIDEDGRYLSEDYTFCRRWQKLGQKIWLDPLTNLSHVGSHIFEGQDIFNVEPSTTKQPEPGVQSSSKRKRKSK